MPQFRIQDILDILILSALIYQLYSWFRKSRAIKVLAGLGTISLIYFISRFTGLQMTQWVLQQLGTVILIVIVVVFQNEIRQTLYRFSRLDELMGKKSRKKCSISDIIAESAFALAAERVGAIIIFQRFDQLDEHLSNGTRLNAEISTPLLGSIFQDGTPLHDGAVLIHEGEIIQAACLLPLSDSPHLPQHLGTRHRAAIGLTERTDAVVLVVSEERGQVSVVKHGELTVISDVEQLKSKLKQLFDDGEKPHQSIAGWLFSDLMSKAAILLVVTVIWLLLAARQGEVAIVQVPLAFHGIPPGLTLVKVTPEEATVRIRSSSALAPSPRQLDLTADLDLSDSHEGVNSIKIIHSDIHVPSGMSVVGVEPATIKIVLKPLKKDK